MRDEQKEDDKDVQKRSFDLKFIESLNITKDEKETVIKLLESNSKESEPAIQRAISVFNQELKAD